MMSLHLVCFFALVASLLICVQGYKPSTGGSLIRKSLDSRTSLFAHHPQKKIIKWAMDKRPKKKRLSDINRNNVNLGKCITKVENAPAEYTLMSAEDFEKIRAQANNFWENGSPSAKWIEITAEDMQLALSPNRDPLPVGGVRKRPPIKKARLH